MTCGRFSLGLPGSSQNVTACSARVSAAVTLPPGNPFGDPPVGDRHQKSGGVRMTIRHQTWLADACRVSHVVVLYFILLEFSKARLP